jgi:hypothetical protein
MSLAQRHLFPDPESTDMVCSGDHSERQPWIAQVKLDERLDPGHQRLPTSLRGQPAPSAAPGHLPREPAAVLGRFEGGVAGMSI